MKNPFEEEQEKPPQAVSLGVAQLTDPRQFPGEHIQRFASPIERQARLLKGRW
ncbi:hypothetical protein QN224_13830 [Sinorhizobium sp. 8-89]|uniref:hypothetical protein n=1 Tax=Sinorhizobium sp. 7-81 TaxID=3049087 RepID=UPI0024C3AEFB|nr:hypothetical protein [Sinorhizobium sp. 7-81]MDK1386486.1 hypothetical protein [Sinorhizobium sp. 7-81]